MPNPKILLLDIETAPIRAYTWGLWDQNVSLNQIDRDWYLLCAAWKWLGEAGVTSVGPISTEDNHNGAEWAILQQIRVVLDTADIVVGHNAKQFDVKKINAKFIEYGIKPPSPYRIVDTFIEAKKHFNLHSNKLDYIADLFGFGRKIKTDFDLWLGCMSGDKKSWAKMLRYNRKDVLLLEKVYLEIRPWMTNHPNVGVFHEGDEPVCPKCGSNHLQRRGFAYTGISKFQRFQCQDCGGWSRGRTNDADRTHLLAGE